MSQPVVLDTNVISEPVKPHPDLNVIDYLRQVSNRSYITSVVLGEIYLGVEILPEGRRKQNLRIHADSVRDAYRNRTIPFTGEMAEHYAVSVAHLKRQGIAIKVNDAYIAAAAATHGAILCTRNLKDFQHYPDLQMQDPWNPSVRTSDQL